MQQQQYEPLHAARHGSSFNLTLVLALGVTVVGAFVMGDPLVVIIGLAFAAFSWFTTPSQYMIFNDRLVIAYGKPRMRHLFFNEMGHVDLLKVGFGDRLLVRLRTGRRFLLQPRDAEEFQGKLEQARESYFQHHPEEQMAPEPAPGPEPGPEPEQEP